MATWNYNSIKEALESCFNGEWIRRMASEVGYCKRNRKVDMVIFFWNLILSLSGGKCRSIAEIQRSYESASGTTLSASSFYDRFTPELTVLLKKAVGLACEKMSEPVQSLTGKLEAFKDLVLADATVFKLHDMLAKLYPACRTNAAKATAKLHMVMSVLAASPRSVEISMERKNEKKLLKIGKWVKDRLILIDLGYFKYMMFELIQRHEGFFISRLIGTGNPKILEDNLPCKDDEIPVAGKKLQEVLPLLKRDVFDFKVEANYRKIDAGGSRRRRKGSFRIVGIKNPETGLYHIYITNVSIEVLSAEDIARTYKVRWEIELLFKELKSYYRLDQLPSSKPYVVEPLIYASILTLIVSRSLLFKLREIGGFPASRTPERRWAGVFKQHASIILHDLFFESMKQKDWRNLERILQKQMIDPNVNRGRNLNVLRN